MKIKHEKEREQVITGLRVRSQLKAGLDKCKKCKLGCDLLSERGKQDACNAICDQILCNAN